MNKEIFKASFWNCVNKWIIVWINNSFNEGSLTKRTQRWWLLTVLFTRERKNAEEMKPLLFSHEGKQDEKCSKEIE